MKTISLLHSTQQSCELGIEGEGEEPTHVEGEEPTHVEGEEPTHVEEEEPTHVEGEEPTHVEGEVRGRSLQTGVH